MTKKPKPENQKTPDQHLFLLDRKSFDFFSELLTKPASDAALERLVATKEPWDSTP
jgi:uncharacterized protein (DUF1778 family)